MSILSTEQAEKNRKLLEQDKANALREDHGLANALAWFQSIKEMIDAYQEPNEATDYTTGEIIALETAQERARDAIQESVLSVEVRAGWHAPTSRDNAQAWEPVEYRILLTTGGPACQLVGELNKHGEPETARLQAQDWFKPWEDVPVGNIAETHFLKIYVDDVSAAYEAVRETLLTFACQFYFGEG